MASGDAKTADEDLYTQSVELGGQSRSAEDLNKTVSESTQQINQWANEFKRDLFRHTKKVKFQVLAEFIRSKRIILTNTEIWNLFLTDQRDAKARHVRNNTLRTNANTYTEDDMKEFQLRYLYFMHKSSQKANTLVFLPNLTQFRYLWTQKFLRNKASSFVCYFFALFLLLLLRMERVATPDGENIFDLRQLTSVAWVVCSFGIFFFMVSLCTENWMRPSWVGAVFLTLFFICFSLAMAILSGTYISRQAYYENQGCYKCVDCSENDIPICWKFQPFEDYLDFRKDVYTDTCTCALRASLQKSFVVGGHSEGCSEEGKHCDSCQAILDQYEFECQTGRDDCDDNMGSYQCMFYDGESTWFFYVGTYICIIFTLEFLIALLQFVVWVMGYIGCGFEGTVFEDVICCGMTGDSCFKQLQEEEEEKDDEKKRIQSK